MITWGSEAFSSVDAFMYITHGPARAGMLTATAARPPTVDIVTCGLHNLTWRPYSSGLHLYWTTTHLRMAAAILRWTPIIPILKLVPDGVIILGTLGSFNNSDDSWLLLTSEFFSPCSLRFSSWCLVCHLILFTLSCIV